MTKIAKIAKFILFNRIVMNNYNIFNIESNIREKLNIESLGYFKKIPLEIGNLLKISSGVYNRGLRKSFFFF